VPERARSQLFHVSLSFLKAAPPGILRACLWQIVGDLDYRTDVYVFLRGADDKLPERPTQNSALSRNPDPDWLDLSFIAHRRSERRRHFELVLMELKSSVTSASSLIEMALSRGVDLGLTIRTFHNGVFSGSADATIIVKVVLTSESFGGMADVYLRRFQWRWPSGFCGEAHRRSVEYYFQHERRKLVFTGTRDDF